MRSKTLQFSLNSAVFLKLYRYRQSQAQLKFTLCHISICCIRGRENETLPTKGVRDKTNGAVTYTNVLLCMKTKQSERRGVVAKVNNAHCLTKLLYVKDIVTVKLQ